ncbi:MAG TPA: hypothetical protein VF151_10925 [Gemmatimonadales bacterium]
MTINIQDYFGKPHTAEQARDAAQLLSIVNVLLEEAQAAGAYDGTEDPDTNCQISGAKGGGGDGGFRCPNSTTGAPHSAHRDAKAVDVYDPGNKLDAWLDSFGELGPNSKLEQYNLYREASSATPGWCHLSTRAPGSGHRTYVP